MNQKKKKMSVGYKLTTEAERDICEPLAANDNLSLNVLLPSRSPLT